MRTPTALIASLAAGITSAQTITVDDDRVEIPDADYTTIHDALANAVDGDTIVVAPGTYTGRHTLDNLSVSIEAMDVSLAPSTIIDGLGTHTCFSINGNGVQNAHITLSGLTIINGVETLNPQLAAGAIVCTGNFINTILEMNDCIVSDSSGNTGAILIKGTDCIFRRCVFTNNTGIMLSSSLGSPVGNMLIEQSDSVHVEDCVFESNRGGALATFGVLNCTIIRSDFLSNTVGYWATNQAGSGGASMSVYNADILTISDCSFRNNEYRPRVNSEESLGGAVYADLVDSAQIERCEFFANSARASNASSKGGAIAATRTEMTVVDCSFVGNSARCGDFGTSRGGAIYNSNTTQIHTSRVVNCTFDSNTCFTRNNINSTSGAGVFLEDNSKMVIANSILRRNTLEDLNTSNGTASNVNIGFGVGSTVTTISNQTANPPGYVRLPDDGGDGWGDLRNTGALDESANDDYGDLRLTEGAGSVNAGNNGQVISTMDIRGYPRQLAQGVDRGAYESGWGIHFVDASATGSGSGASWNNAATHPEDFLQLEIGGEMRIAEGTYALSLSDRSFNMHSELDILGGYPPGGGPTADPLAHPVIFLGDVAGDDQAGGINRGDNAEHVVSAIGVSEATLSGVTIIGGNAPVNGGGLLIEDSTDVVLFEVTVEDCDAVERAAALFAVNSDFSVEHSTIRNNRSAVANGAARIEGGSASFDHVEFSENSTPGSSGALTIAGGAIVTVVDSLFENNTSGMFVGAILAGETDTELYIENSVFTGNSAESVSAVRYANGASGVIAQSLFSNNTATNQGTVRVLNASSSLSIYQSTIANNTATVGTAAGAQSVGGATLIIEDTILHGNTSPGGTDIVSAQILGDFTGHHNLIQGWTGDANTAIDADPAFMDSPNGDFSIGEGSGAIDAGEGSGWLAFVPVDPTLDLAEQPRFADDTGTPDTGVLHTGETGVIDIGAFEFQGTTPSGCLADTNGDGLVTPADFSAWVAAFNSMAPECDQNNDGVCSPADFSAWVSNYNAGC